MLVGAEEKMRRNAKTVDEAEKWTLDYDPEAFGKKRWVNTDDVEKVFGGLKQKLREFPVEY